LEGKERAGILHSPSFFERLSFSLSFSFRSGMTSLLISMGEEGAAGVAAGVALGLCLSEALRRQQQPGGELRSEAGYPLWLLLALCLAAAAAAWQLFPRPRRRVGDAAKQPASAVLPPAGAGKGAETKEGGGLPLFAAKKYGKSDAGPPSDSESSAETSSSSEQLPPPGAGADSGEADSSLGGDPFVGNDKPRRQRSSSDPVWPILHGGDERQAPRSLSAAVGSPAQPRRSAIRLSYGGSMEEEDFRAAWGGHFPIESVGSSSGSTGSLPSAGSLRVSPGAYGPANEAAESAQPGSRSPLLNSSMERPIVIEKPNLHGLAQTEAAPDVHNEYEIVYSRPSAVTKLHWQGKPHTVLIISKIFDPTITPIVSSMAAYLAEAHGISVCVERAIHEQLPHLLCCEEIDGDLEHVVDLVIVLGGDGTLLHVNSLFGGASCPPVMAFAMGSLGFLAPFNIDHFQDQLDTLLDGEECHITLRSRLQCSHFRATVADGATPEAGTEDKSDRQPKLGSHVPMHPKHELADSVDALNEVVIDRGKSGFLTHLLLYINNRFVTAIQADGIIIATATGSTAYSLSANGSLVHPSVGCILLTPICPHTLSFRPMVLPPSSTIRIQVPLSAHRNSSPSAAFDGRHQRELAPGDAISVRLSRNTFPSITRETQMSDWIETVVRNLNWNRRVQQKEK
jgi:NAD+ kinase